jgi:glycosyltransferase involved in cell wall biosynthesis
MRDTKPRLSVILPVYNGQDYLAQAIDSVLSQSFRDLELIIIDDGSTDGSGAIIESADDPRIWSFRQSNRGLAATLNRAIALARGEYIARQDQDDISLPSRLAKQIGFLDANPDVGMLGTSAEIWVGNVRSDRHLRHPADNAALKFGLLFDNHFVHSSVMIRRDVLEAVGGYSEDPARQPPEDYELWSRVMKRYRLANLPDVLLAYREVAGSMSRTGVTPFVHKLVRISSENIAWAAGLPVDSIEVNAVANLSHGVFEQIPRGTSFSGMKAVLRRAAHGIAADAGVSPLQLDDPLRWRIRQLRYRYLDYRYGGWIGKILQGRARSMAKRMAERIL